MRSFQLLFLIALLLKGSLSYAQPAADPTSDVSDDSIELGEEYTEYKKEQKSSGSTSPEDLQSWLVASLLYLPNRVLDLIDIAKLDVGIGPAVGAVVRPTKYAQVGYRSFMPASLRVGLRGRKLPVFVERSNEFGVGPVFHQSADREVTPVEIGAGVDVVIIGAYAGLSLDEAFDFILGFVGVDIKDDDL